MQSRKAESKKGRKIDSIRNSQRKIRENRQDSARERHRLLSSGLIVVGVLALACFLVRAEQRQYVLNRELIGALVNHDAERALHLVDQGADPNTPYKPPAKLYLVDIWNLLIYQKKLPIADSPTAFQMLCGSTVIGDEVPMPIGLYAPQLLETMLRHGGKVNSTDFEGQTPLMVACHQDGDRHAERLLLKKGLEKTESSLREHTVDILIQHGANVNAHDFGDNTSLLIAIRDHAYPETISLLIEHGANVNAQNEDGDTPIALATTFPADDGPTLALAANANWSRTDTEQVVTQLLAHGANPNLRNHQGETALTLAQKAHRADLVALMQHYRK